MTTNPKTDADLVDEPLPAVDDDAEPDAVAPATARQDEGEGDEQLAPRRRGDEGREAIAKRYRELQAEEREEREEELSGGPDDIAALDKPDAGRTESEPEDDPELELLVFGNRHKHKRSELIQMYDLVGLSDQHIISVAQKQMAADQRLREAKEVADQRLTESSQRLNGAREGGETDQADQLGEPRPDDADGLATDRPPQGLDQALNEETLDDIVQRVQFGDADEAKQALRDYAGVIRSSIPGASPEEVLNHFEQRLAQRQHQTEIYNALTKFGDENPDLIADKHLTTVGLDLAAEEMLKDMRQIGLTDEQLAPIAGDRKAIATAHRAVRQQGHKVRSLDEVLGAAGETLRTKFHIPKESSGQGTGSQTHQASSSPATARERMHRKEIAQQQPRHGGARAGTPQETARPKTAIELIEEQRRHRNFPSLRA